MTIFTFYRPQTKFAKVMFLHVSVCSRGGGSTWAGTPLGPGTPSGQVPPVTRYTPLGRYTPRDQVHPLAWAGTPRDQVHPLAWAGTLRDQVHPPGQAHLRDQVHPLGRYTPQTRYTPRGSACWEIWTTSGRYTSYWNAFLSLIFFAFASTFARCE